MYPNNESTLLFVLLTENTMGIKIHNDNTKNAISNIISHKKLSSSLSNYAE